MFRSNISVYLWLMTDANCTCTESQYGKVPERPLSPSANP